MIVYLMNGSLPWQGLKTSSKREKYRRVLEMKQTTTVETLCQGLPAAFTTYFKYLQTLTAADIPDYHYIRTLFRQPFRQKGFEHDFVFDWAVIEFFRHQSDDESRVDEIE